MQIRAGLDSSHGLAARETIPPAVRTSSTLKFGEMHCNKYANDRPPPVSLQPTQASEIYPEYPTSDHFVRPGQRQRTHTGSVALPKAHLQRPFPIHVPTIRNKNPPKLMPRR